MAVEGTAVQLDVLARGVTCEQRLLPTLALLHLTASSNNTRVPQVRGALGTEWWKRAAQESKES